MREDNVRKIWSEAELDAALSDLHAGTGDDDGLAFARASLMTAAGTAEAPPQPRRTGTWRWIAVAAAVVMLVSGLAIVTSLRTPASDPAQPAATIPDIDRPLAPGEFHYTQKLTWLDGILFDKLVKIQQSIELWIPADPTGVWHRRTKWTGAVRGLDKSTKPELSLQPFDENGPAGRFGTAQNLGGQVRSRWNTPFENWLAPDAAFIASLTPDRGKLSKRLNFDTITEKDSGKMHTPTEALTMVRTALETGLVRKDIRFALSDAFGGIIGGFVATDGHTPDGRPATVLVAKDSDQRLYLDPKTAVLLAWEDRPAFVPTTSRPGPPVSTAKTPSSAVLPPPTTTSEPQTTTTTVPRADGTVPLPEDLPTTYSFAITRTSG